MVWIHGLPIEKDEISTFVEGFLLCFTKSVERRGKMAFERRIAFYIMIHLEGNK